MMPLGFVSAILPEMSLAEVLGVAAKIGYSCVEVMCWPPSRAERRYAGVTHIDVAGLTESRITEVQRLVAESGVWISGLGYYPNCLAADPAEAEQAVAHLSRVIVAAPRLGLAQVNTFIGRDHTASIADNWPRMLATWKPLVDLAEKHGVRIGIENCPMLFTRDEWPGGKNLFTTPAVWRRAFADIGSPAFGLNYDPSHLVLQDMNPMAPLEEFRERLFHLHAKDVRIDRRALDEVGRFDFPLRWHQPRLPGYGEIDWGRFMAEVMRVGYDGPVCIEVEDDTFGRSLAGRQRALRVARNVLAPFVPR
jgi:sugar phosphate isomerase/epimerase